MEIALEILDVLDSSRERVLVALEDLPDEALLEARAVTGLGSGEYSVADVLALQVAWEAELVTGLMRIDQGKKPEKLLAALAEPAVYDARRYEEFKGRDLDLIFDDLQQVRMQLETWLEIFSERDLTSRKRFDWLRGKSLRELITAVTTTRELAYLPDLEQFAQRWLRENKAEPDSFIPLTAVSPEENQHDEQPD